MKLRVPRGLTSDDALAIVAPASPPGRYVVAADGTRSFDDTELRRGLAWLYPQFRLVADSELLLREGYLAGNDAARTRAFARAIRDPRTRGLLAARGGYGAMRILDQIPWDAIVSDPKWLVGFSDITALQLAALSNGVASIHGPNATSLAHARPYDRFLVSAFLRGRTFARKWNCAELLPTRAGHVSGTVVGGNLTLIHAMAAAGRLALPEKSILLLEDVTERPYRIDRMLTALRLSGAIEKVAAIVFGSFTDCTPGPDGITIPVVLSAFANDVAAAKIPIVFGAPFGHGSVNEAFIQGEVATLEGGALTLSGVVGS